MLEIALTGMFLFIVFLGVILLLTLSVAGSAFRAILEEMLGPCGSCIYILVIVVPVFLFIL